MATKPLPTLESSSVRKATSVRQPTQARMTVAEFRAAKPKAPSKYKNVRTAVNGIKFASKREARRYQELKLLEAAGRVRSLALQVPFDLYAGPRGEETLICRYVADFQYEERVGRKWILVTEDAKGARRGAAYQIFTLKKRLMWAILQIDVKET